MINLRCEYRTNPLGVDDAAPRLSWVLESEERGQSQTAYQVLAASSLELLTHERGDLLDSGKVASDQSLHVEYADQSLRSHQRIHWSVQVWDRNGQPMPWGEPATWTAGVLAQSDWQAKWVSTPTAAGVHRLSPG